MLKSNGIKLSEGSKIHPSAYLLYTLIKGTKKKGAKKEVVVVATVEQLLSSNAPLTLIKRKRVNKTLLVVDVSKESSVDKETRIKRMKITKETPIVEASEKVGESVPAVETKKVIYEEAIAPKKGTTEKVIEVRSEEEIAELNVLDKIEKVTSPLVREGEPSNLNGQIRGVLNDLRRTKEDEVSTPHRAQLNVDYECTLAAQLEEHCELMGTDEVVGRFVNEPDRINCN